MRKDWYHKQKDETNRTIPVVIDEAFEYLLQYSISFHQINEIPPTKSYSLGGIKIIEAILIESGLVESQDAGSFKRLKINTKGIVNIHRYRSYSNYLKKTTSFPVRHPVCYDIIKIFVAVILTGSITLGVTLYTAKQKNQEHHLLDMKQDNAIKVLSDSLKNLQKHK